MTSCCFCLATVVLMPFVAFCSGLVSLAKTVLFYFYFMAILILSHLFLCYFILTKLYFISILPDKENRASILFEFYFYFNPILKQD